MHTAGVSFRRAMDEERPLQIVGAVNANHALLAKRVGFRAIYLSGGGVAAGSLGMPDLGLAGLDDVLVDARRITDVCDLPLMVDVDTGFGPSTLNIARTTRALIKAGAAALQIEDQVMAKRCGHRPNKEVVPLEEMVARIQAALEARTDDAFVVVARTDALAVEGIESALERTEAYAQAGADVVFPEAVTDLQMYRRFSRAARVPILANMTEFGVTPLATVSELADMDVGLVLYPLSAFRAMNKAAQIVFESIRKNGTQAAVLETMQTRSELYEAIDYHSYEQRLDLQLNGK